MMHVEVFEDLECGVDMNIAAELFADFALHGVGRKLHEIDATARRPPTLERAGIIQYLDRKQAIVSARDCDGDHTNGFDGAPSRIAGSSP